MFLLQYSLAYACLKLVNYSFFFWLPFYLSNNFGWKEAEADKLSIWYDVGGIVGTHVHISFHTGRRLASFEVLLLAPQPSLPTHPTSKHADLCENKKVHREERQPETAVIHRLSFLSLWLMDQSFCLGTARESL